MCSISPWLFQFRYGLALFRVVRLFVTDFWPFWLPPTFFLVATTVRYASGCSVEMCTMRNPSNTGCSNLPACYQFDTSINTSVCAPQVICSLFDSCNSLRRCATSTSVCVINSCCAAPICMPLSLVTSCSMYSSNSTRTPASGRKYWIDWAKSNRYEFHGSFRFIANICSNATWAENSTIIINSYSLNTSYSSLGDFVVDSNNNLYVIDTSGSRVVKFSLSNPSTYNVVTVTNLSSNYQPTHLFLDANGTIYTAEQMVRGMIEIYWIFPF